MRLPRMTTRRWMIFVVIVALLMGTIVGGVRLRQRREGFAVRAIHHAMRKAECERFKLNVEEMLMIDSLLNKVLKPEQRLESPEMKAAKPKWPDEVTRMERAIAYHAAMQRKYEDAAQRPWFAVEPDPQEPQ